MTQILLQIKSDSLAIVSTSSSNGLLSSTWFWFSIVEFTVIIFLVLRLRKKKMVLTFSDLPKDKMKNAKTSSIDMDNLMNSING